MPCIIPICLASHDNSCIGANYMATHARLHLVWETEHYTGLVIRTAHRIHQGDQDGSIWSWMARTFCLWWEASETYSLFHNCISRIWLNLKMPLADFCLWKGQAAEFLFFVKRVLSIKEEYDASRGDYDFYCQHTQTSCKPFRETLVLLWMAIIDAQICFC